MASNSTIIISGMHRSGTSLVSSVLQGSGVNVGDNLLGSNQSNPGGHYEDKDFLDFHQSVLGEENKDGFRIAEPPEVDFAHQQLALKLIAARHHQPLWGWKDPRTCLFLDFWQEQMDEARFILIYRHPLEVILSLIKRGSDWELIKDPQKSILLWEVYNQRILDFKRRYNDKCLLCNLSGITSDINGFLSMVADQFEAPLTISDGAQRYRKDQLNQYNWSGHRSELLASLLGNTLGLYQELEESADLASYTKELDSLDFPWTSFDNFLKIDQRAKPASSSLFYLLSNFLDDSQTSRFFQSSDKIFDAQNAELKTRIELIATQHDELNQLEKAQLKLSKELEETVLIKEQITSLNNKLMQSKKELGAKDGLVEKYLEHIEERDSVISQSEQEFSVQEKNIASHKDEIDKLSKQASGYRAQLLSKDEEISKFELAISKLDERAQQRDMKSAAQDRSIAKQSKKIKKLKRIVKTHSRANDALLQSLYASRETAELQQGVIQARESAMAAYQQELAAKTSALKTKHHDLVYYKSSLINAQSTLPIRALMNLQGKFNLLIAIGKRITDGYNPLTLFDAEWYRSKWPESKWLRTHPYLHYSVFGWREGRNPNPYFDVQWYLEEYPDVLLANKEPLRHYALTGWLEGRDPSPRFSTANHLKQFPYLLEQKVNPLLHFLSDPENQAYLNEDSPDLPTTNKQSGAEGSSDLLAPAIIDQVSQSESDNCYQQEFSPNVENSPVRLIAFYLPQFHPIPENDQFWGEGFTEWTNVTKSTPQYEGHYQPQLPGSLGFYDLRLPDVMRRQAELARQYGIDGFCFHFYWFNGRRLLEKPVEQLLADPDIPIQFCLNWANENWTRSWDGKAHEVLIEQKHSPEDDLDFIKEVSRYFEDPRYIRVDGKPVLMVYNPSLLPDATNTAKRWRDYCEKSGHELFLMVGETHGFNYPEPAWFDAVVEFPPLRRLPEDRQADYNVTPDFNGRIFNYSDLIDVYSEDIVARFPVFKTVSPGWDNTARRGDEATIFAGATPSLFQTWLSRAIEGTTRRHSGDQRMVFINAWNEWAEGAFLEPDQKYGYAYLNSAARAIQQHDPDEPVLLVTSHDANLGGAQNLLLTLLMWFKTHTELKIKILIGADGVLRPRFEALYPTFVLENHDANYSENVAETVSRFCGGSVSLIFMNTVVSARLMPSLQGIKAHKIMYVHELSKSIEKFYGDKKFARDVKEINQFIGGSQPVVDNLVKSYNIPKTAVSVLESFITPGSDFPVDRTENKESLGFTSGSTIIVACGMVEWRKGPDLFINVAKELLKTTQQSVDFVWIGPLPSNPDELMKSLRGYEEVVHFVGEKTNFKEYFEAADIYLLPSREDPFPLVLLEAADSQLPIVTFAENGGSPKFIEESNCGYCVPFEDTDAMTQKVSLLINDKALRNRLGVNGSAAVRDNYSDKSAGPRLLQTIREVAEFKPKVSVIVPAYNHADFLEKRLESIYNQTFQDIEVIILDDASTDNTSSILEPYRQRAITRVLSNEQNSGSPFRQWLTGLQHARADIIWIAEDDDFSDHSFLQKMLPLFEDPELQLAFCQSHAVDENDDILFSYDDYYKHEFANTTRWQASYKVDAEAEINQGLSIINTIPNASSVLFRKFDTEQWASDWVQSRLAGDWAFYLSAIRGGKIAFYSEHLNYHRRHQATMTHTTKSAELRFEEVSKVHRDALQMYQVNEKTRNLMREKMWSIWQETHPGKTRKMFDQSYDQIITSDFR